MTQLDFAVLLAILGGTYIATAVIGKFTGDARRDVRLMAGVGSVLAAIAGLLSFV